MSENNFGNQSNQSNNQPNYPQFQNMDFHQKRKRKWWIPLLIVFGVIGIFVFFVIGLVVYFGSKLGIEENTYEVKTNSVLYLDFAGGANEYTKPNPFDFLGKKNSSASLFESLIALRDAKTDKNIKGVFIHPSRNIGITKMMELNEAIVDFKKSGKFVYAFIETGDENTYLSTVAADSIFMPTEGILEFNGFFINRIFLKGMLNKIGVDFYVQQFEDFKSAGEEYSRKNFSDSARYNYSLILNQRLDNFLEQVSLNRNLPKEKVKQILFKGIYGSDEAKENKLIDGFMTLNQVKEFIKAKINIKQDEKLKLVTVGNYSNSNIEFDKKNYKKDNGIAIISGVGAISSGGSSSGFGDDLEIKSGEFVSMLKKARKDKDIKAIVIRIDSPGGSVIASDEIWEEIQITKKEKPVIASMSDVAASGGYYMAMACDKIVAHPQTITGSIGVILAIPNFTNTMNKLEITADTITTNSGSLFMMPTFPFSDADKNKLYSLSSKIYDRFLERVALSRNKTKEEIRVYAKGRVWTGKEAKQIGLVDELGGLQTAIDLAKKAINIDPKYNVDIYTYPEKEEGFESFIKAIKNDPNDDNESSISQIIGDKLSLTQNIIKYLPKEFQESFKYTLSLLKNSNKEKVQMALPNLIDIH